MRIHARKKGAGWYGTMKVKDCQCKQNMTLRNQNRSRFFVDDCLQPRAQNLMPTTSSRASRPRYFPRGNPVGFERYSYITRKVSRFEFHGRQNRSFSPRKNRKTPDKEPPNIQRRPTSRQHPSPVLHHSFICKQVCHHTQKMKFSLAFLSTLGAVGAFVPLHPARNSFSSRPLAAVARKDSYDVTLLPGDGIGPEITAATKVVLKALTERCGFTLNLKEALIGGAALDAVNDPFPDESLAQCQASDSVLLACIGGYKWDSNPRELRPESGLLKMRKSMQLFANLRPAKVLPQLIDSSTLKREVVEGVDVMVVRELTGDVYFGTPKGIDVVNGK